MTTQQMRQPNSDRLRRSRDRALDVDRSVIASGTGDPVGKSTRVTSTGARVLLVGPFANSVDSGGGVGAFLRNLRESQLGKRFSFQTFSTQRPPKPVPRRDDSYGNVLRAGFWPAIYSAAVTLYHVLLFPWVVLVSRARIVQIQSSSYWTFWESACYVIWTRLLGRKAILRYGGAAPKFFQSGSHSAKFVTRVVLRLSHRMIVQSQSWRRFFADWTDEERLFVLPNSVDPAEYAWERDFDRDTRTVFFLGGNEAVRKGLKDLVAIVEAVVGKAPNTRFHIVAEFESVLPMIPARARDHVRYDHKVDGAEKYRAFQEADIYILPTYGEGFPNALLEAMAAALPVIVTPVGAIPEVVEEDVNGFIIAPGDREALIDRIVRLAEDRSLCRRMGEENRRKVQRCYNRDSVFAQLEGLYEALLAEGGRRESGQRSSAHAEPQSSVEAMLEGSHDTW